MTRLQQYSRSPWAGSAVFLAESASAVLVNIEGEELWIPVSQIEDDSQIYAGCPMQKGDVGELVISHWIAKKKGLV